MTSRLHILTGASRGLGAAMAEQLLGIDTTLLCISRHVNVELAAKAEAAPAQLEQWSRDLGDPLPLARQVEAWLHGFDAAQFDEAVLINNAGVITHIGPVDAGSDEELSAALRVGLEAAMLLTRAFLRATGEWRARRQGGCKVLNISSGLGRRAMAGSAVYCAAKAGMDHFSRAVALDEAHRGHAARVVSLAPGVIDTDMQKQLRSADPGGFPEQDMFVTLRASGQLTRPRDAAARVLAYLQRDDFGTDVVADVRQ
ncbi:SDR family NAD(P)-dependent oxidoreductase [Piscinibacter sp. XHJ-5]|uniref:SDR family NAD(P)-dependent oxidoreductase n=1 Tax=Piscinibacter sp. XHJ-5 TaxID=3037797 RepID=UPI002452B7EE|nr:SDR family NAD(P)-dependent oxidoreductase [Piscinibacter sp. XHJ-5]